MKKIYFILLICINTLFLNSQSTGDIAFIGFNVDGEDDFAIVALESIPANTSIYFTDNEPDGANSINSGEGFIQWTSPSTEITAGTVIIFSDVSNSSNLMSSIGTLVDGSGALNFSGEGDALFAYLGTDETSPTTFLAGIQNETGNQGSNLADTGLTEGTTFVTFTTSGSPDGGQYIGSRDSESVFSNYLALIADPNNWATETSDGEAILPFNSSNFSLAAASNGPVITNVLFTPNNPTSSDAVTISADITDTDGIGGADIRWGTTSGSANLTNTVAMSNTSGDSYEGIIPAQTDGATVYFEIYALDNNLDETTSTEQNYIVTDPDCFDLSNGSELFELVAVVDNSQTDQWSYNAGNYSINGFVGSGVSENIEQWLIFGPLDLTTTTNLALSFDANKQFSNTDLLVRYTTDYSIGCPSEVATSWTTVQTITNTGATTVDLSSVTGTAVFIGIQYIDDGADGYSSWTLSNMILDATNCPVLGTRPTSDCSTLSLEQPNSLSKFQIYPNPSNTERITIFNPSSETISVTVFNMLGKQVKKASITNTLDISDLESGVYLLSLSQNDTTSTKKLVVN